jgi:hypothetical protein
MEMSKRVVRNFPSCSLEKSLSVAQKLQDESAGRALKRLLLADALGIKPASTNFRDILSASYKYGLTEGSEKSPEITLTALGEQATNTRDTRRQREAFKRAILVPPIFKKFYTAYNDRKLPSPDMLRKLLTADYGVGVEYADECARIILENGRFAGIIQDIGGSPHVMLDTGAGGGENDEPPMDTSPLEIGMVDFDLPGARTHNGSNGHSNGHTNEQSNGYPLPGVGATAPVLPTPDAGPRPIFIGHGKKRGPLERLEKLLTTFKIPFKVVIDEPNLARPIPKKVRDTMLECNSAILIFTGDEKFHDENGNEIWRPSENVVHELGAASFAYEDRVVIFKEKGLTFPTNFSNIGYIEFEENSIEARAMELMQELVAMGLVRITPV